MSEIEFFSVESESENSSASDLEEKVVMPKKGSSLYGFSVIDYNNYVYACHIL